jgi:hypothetical protein
MFPIIGLVGEKGSGKTTVANHLVTRGYTEVSFADTLKNSLCVLLDMERICFDDPKKKEDTTEFGLSPREMMQGYGDMTKSLFGSGIFINSVYRRLQKIQTPIVISDIRFPAEADFVRRLGNAWIYRIVRGGGDTTCIQEGDFGVPLENVPIEIHCSESVQYSISCDATILNSVDMGLGDLYAAVDMDIFCREQAAVML